MPGQFYVDETCINCDTCRWMAPKSFSRVGQGSAVVKQPADKDSRLQAIQATLSCPTFSIHMQHSDKDEVKEAQDGMPIPVPECPGVYHCGFHSEKSFGATSYLIVRKDGNILMDAPRFNPLLAKKIAALGGVKHMILSHIDDIADHDRWAAHFGCPRVMHGSEIGPDIADIEVQLSGEGPWALDGSLLDDGQLDGDVLLVHTPGHSKGSICLWHAPTQAMFTGDHLGYSERAGRVSIFPRYNKVSIRQQLDSVEKLLAWDFLHVLPGHGRRFHLRDATNRLQVVSELIQAETVNR